MHSIEVNTRKNDVQYDGTYLKQEVCEHFSIGA